MSMNAREAQGIPSVKDYQKLANEKLSHLIYVSRRTPDCDDAQIEDILAACKRNNHEDDITGVLIYRR